MKTKLKYILLLLFIIACGNDDSIAEEQEVELVEPKITYRTYKRTVSTMKSDRNRLERHSNIENAGHYILKTFDNYKSKIPSNSSSE